MTSIVCSTVEIDLSDVDGINEVICLTDAPIDIEYQKRVYRSFGALLSIDPVTTENVLSDGTMKITLSGLDKTIMSVINSTSFRNKPVIVRKAIVSDGRNEITEQSIYYRGLTGTPETSVDYASGSVSLGLGCKSVFDLNKTPSLMRSNNSTHQFYHAGDLFFQFANDQKLADEQWQTKN
jgi:hypothetical protein